MITTLVTHKGNLVIEFLDNPFVTEFVNHFNRIRQTYKLISYREDIPYKRHKWDPVVIAHQQQVIIAAITKLNDLGLQFPVPIDDIVLAQDTVSRQLLNRLHRCFTTSHHTRTTWELGTSYTFNLDQQDYAPFGQAVHSINDAVHAVESYYSNDRVHSFTPRTEFQLVFDSNQPIDPSNDPQSDYFQEISSPHQKYFTDQLAYDVWLPLHQIQGKNYWICYFDQDDPTNWDISTNIIYSGSMAIGDRSASRDPVLLAWLRSFGIDPGPQHCGMPLGNIIQGRELINIISPEDILEIQ